MFKFIRVTLSNYIGMLLKLLKLECFQEGTDIVVKLIEKLLTGKKNLNNLVRMKLCLLNIFRIDCSPFDSSPLLEVQLLCHD